MKKLFAMTVAVLLLFSVLLGIPAAYGQAPETGKTLDILFSHDTHSHLNAFTTVVEDEETDIGGFARANTLIKAQRAKNPDTLVIDGGDFSMGTLIQTVFETQAAELRMLGYMGYDVTTFGNHEFDYRSKGLANMLTSARTSGDAVPSIVICNVDWDAMEAAGLTEGQQMLKDAFAAYGVQDYTPMSDDLPWCMVPERKVTPEDIKYMLSSHYQGTPYDPYLSYGDKSAKGAYRSIGINRNDFMALLQMRPDQPEESRAVEWVAYASNAFNTMVPFYANVERTPEYLANTTGTVSTDNFYWTSRLIAAMADASYNKSLFHLERYEEAVLSAARALVNGYDAKLAAEPDAASRAALREEANTAIAAMLQEKAADTLDKVLFELSSQMKNAYSRSDA